MKLKDQLLEKGYDVIDILVIDENQEQNTIPDITLHKVNDLEYKLFIEPESIEYHLEEENPYFTAKQREEDGESLLVKCFVIEW
ncbi:hypothetical protein [Thalassobacillus hwangdonensis]|uniref:Uncharacterized protein n=1 Tax=Thalassobacillus hwangdonensis TaxID=546108 RepID=A0ABW3L1P8_9BACI